MGRTYMDVLEDLMRLEDVLLAMVVSAPGRIYSPKTTKLTDIGLLHLIKGTMDNMLDIMNKFFPYGMDRTIVEIRNNVIFIYLINRTTALVCVVPQLSNMGLLEVEIENARKELREMMKNV